MRRLLSETELRSFNLNEDYRYRYQAESFVASACIILDAKSANWFNELDLNYVRTESPYRALEHIEKFFKEETQPRDLTVEIEEVLGIIESAGADAKHLTAAWIDEITMRRAKRFMRNLMNLF
ncbi:MAG TPA: hypothetical protein VEB18_00685 [Candidatus Paceibacterota bacterium]|nr:hypothetical protein [Candidatus Paceibacterota bacterium]